MHTHAPTFSSMSAAYTSVVAFLTCTLDLRAREAQDVHNIE